MKYFKRLSHRIAVLRLVLPPVLAVSLFILATWWIILPATEEALLESKRETLRAIVASALSLCERHYAAELAGKLDRQQAQTLAAADLRALRYGDANKDYLWLIDHTPRMIAHPYRSDLEGRDLTNYADPDGIRLFAESVALVVAKNEGFVHYRWQWQDDPSRIVPKLSYVRDFIPWGWIVGSGIYLDDVQTEISRTTHRLLWISACIGALIAALVAIGLRQGWISERLRRITEDELAQSHARYQTLAHAAEGAVWLVVDQRVTGANRSACTLLGRPETELLGMEIAQLFAADAAEPSPGMMHETLLATPSGLVPALVVVSSASVLGRAAKVFTARDLRLGANTSADERRRREDAEALLRDALLVQVAWLAPAAPHAQTVPVLPLSSTPEEVGSALTERNTSAALLAAPDGGVVGIVTAGDLVRRGGKTAYAAMSAPLRRLHCTGSIAEALDTMVDGGVRRLLLESKGEPPRLLAAEQLLAALRLGPTQLVAAASHARQEEFSDLRHRMEAWLRALSALHLDAERVAAEGTRIADAILVRCIELTLSEMGSPPSPCALAVVGSQGRREMMPGSDQDNALIYVDAADEDWFHAFSKALVTRYAAAGWPPCKGGTVASNPRWCMPLSAWKARFSGWIKGGSPLALMEIATFFDLRAVWGQTQLVDDLQAHALEAAAEREIFLHQMARDALDFRAPLGPFGAIRTETEHTGTLDIKGALMHFVAFARVMSLRYRLHETGTGARLHALAASGYLDQTVATDAIDSWRFLLGKRLALRFATDGDHLDPQTLSAWDLAVLKRALVTISALQTRLRHDVERAG
jgi:signal-transduction protein with cAMP-binding, CBS, and nucleotidyltransferase domain/PAS domain-containing protein